MPKVPTYDGPQLQEQALPGARYSEVDVTRNQRALAAGLQSAAGEIDRYQQRKDQDDAFAAEAKIKADWLDYEGKLREARKGRDAHAYDQEVSTWWQERAKTAAEGLSPGAQRLVSRSLMTSQLQAVAGAKAYREQQLNASAAASYQAAQGVAIEEAARLGTPEAVAKALTDINERIKLRGAEQGWAPEQVAAEKLARSTVLHASVLESMVKRDPAAAQAYFARVNAAGEIDSRAREAIGARLEQTGALVDGGNAAGEVWQALGPKSLNAPINEAGMQAELRKRFGNDPARLKAAQSALAEMSNAHDKSQAEANAYGVNMVYKALDAGQPLSKVRLSQEFQQLPGDMQARIQEDIEQRIDRRTRRVADAEQAELSRYQRQNALALMRNPDLYLRYSDPATLSGMTRQQVEALRPTLGLDATQHLLGRWDQLQKPAAKIEARMDNEDFNHVADRLGLSPYKANTEDKRRQLGELKFRVEKLIDSEQAARKGPLTREEKMKLMETEMARTVTVNPLLGFKRDVPVIQLTPDQVKNVVVPETDRGQIAEALKTMYQRTKNPMYAPTEENMRRLYLMNKSPAGALLPAEK